ncbi:MAG: nicotinate-nucleotide adenylyltransferase [Planctomycetaceae bacterium]
MRLGIFGGTFDPVHFGHLLLAETCREQLNLDEVRFVPAGVPPHKQQHRISDGHCRADMLQLAISGYPEYVVDRREIRRQGPSFTVDTLTELAEEFSGAELFFLMGADSLRDVPGWRDPKRICELAVIVAVNRPGIATPTAQQVHDWVGSELADRIHVLSMPGADLSATELRKRAAAGKNLRFMTPRAVEAFIVQHNVYQPQSDR